MNCFLTLNNYADIDVVCKLVDEKPTITVDVMDGVGICIIHYGTKTVKGALSGERIDNIVYHPYAGETYKMQVIGLDNRDRIECELLTGTFNEFPQ